MTDRCWFVNNGLRVMSRKILETLLDRNKAGSNGYSIGR